MSENNQNALENKEISIELNEEIAEGIYSNLAIVSHSSSEFVLDFIRVMPGVSKAKVKSRIVLSPEHALRLLGALQDNLKQYEAQAIAAANAQQQQQQGQNTQEPVKGDFPYPLDFGNSKGEA